MKRSGRIVGAVMAVLTAGLAMLTGTFMYRCDIAGAMLSFFMASCFCYFTYVAFSYKG